MSFMEQKGQNAQKQFFDPQNPEIKHEILSLIIQYLDESGYRSSATILSDEAQFNAAPDSTRTQDLLLLKNSLKENGWSQIESLQFDKSQSPRFIYQLYRHHFLELVLSGDSHSALQFLSSRLRPYKAFEDPPGDFDSLCLLLVDAASSSRTAPLPDLNESCQKLISYIDQNLDMASAPISEQPMQSGRLVHLIQQAAAHQLSCYPRGAIKSMVTDFEPAVLPASSPKALPKEHSGVIKSVAIVPNTEVLLSGGSDGNVVVWDLKRKMKSCVLKGHRGRIWSLASKKTNLAASGGGDGSIRVWSMQTREQLMEFNHKGDVYAVDIDTSGTKLIGGGFDRKFALYDLETGKEICSKMEHQAAITATQFDPTGNMAVTGGKDLSIKIWDLRNGIVVRSLSPVLSEVTSVAADRSFSKILGSTKNSSHRIWDMRMSEAVLLLNGHQNSARHFVRGTFGPDDRTIISGSDDGKVYVWGTTSGKILETFPAHAKGVYGAVYCEATKQFVSYGDDSVILTWDRKLSMP